MLKIDGTYAVPQSHAVYRAQSDTASDAVGVEHTGEAGHAAACPIKSPFTAVKGVEAINGQREEDCRAASAIHDVSDPEGKISYLKRCSY